MKILRSLSIFLLLNLGIWLTPLAQQSASSWSLRVEGHTFLILQIKKDGTSFKGKLSMPKAFQVGPGGRSFSKVKSPIQKQTLTKIALHGSKMTFTTTDGQQWELTPGVRRQTAQLRMLGVPLDPWTLSRGGPLGVSTDWNVNKTYSLDTWGLSSAEMKRIYSEDQRGRHPGDWTAERWSELAKSDRLRRQEARGLLENKELHTADDFARAAFVFQHGESKEDYLLAHTLALASLALGNKGAAWIAAATLDAYLQAVNQPQIFGTRFVIKNGKAIPKPSYDSNAIPEQLRRQLGLPSLEVEGEQFIKANQ
jgi:hypothetical protein